MKPFNSLAWGILLAAITVMGYSKKEIPLRTDQPIFS